MESIFPARGCLVRVDHGGSGSFYEMKPPIGGTSDSPVLLTGATVTEEDIVLPKSTLDGFEVLYSFGAGFGQVQITGVVLLGNQTAGKGAGLAAVIRYFRKHRTAVSKKPVQLSMPGSIAYNIFLTTVAVGQVDPVFNTQAFMFSGMPIEQN